MAIRKASAYSKKPARPYTRKSRRKGKAYVKVVPSIKIAKYNMGNEQDYNNGKHIGKVKLISEEGCQIRDNAIEAARMYSGKILDKEVAGQYFMVVKMHPHHMLRDNKTAAGAGADRMSTGMTHSFGVTVGRAALISPNQELFFISCANEKAVKVARKVLQQIKSKLPCRTKIVFEALKKIA